MSTSLSNRVFRNVSTTSRTAWVLAFGAVLFAAVPTRAATTVAVIDHNLKGFAPGEDWCQLLAGAGHECEVFPSSGPTRPLDEFSVVIDLSETWTDPTETLPDQLRVGKGVILWGEAPIALGLFLHLTVREWVGANASGIGRDELQTVAADPILGSIPIGTELAFCEEPCDALADTTGHSRARVLARFPDSIDAIGILRNSWEGGQTVYLTEHIEPYLFDPAKENNEIIRHAVDVLSHPVPAVSDRALFGFVIAIAVIGSILLRHRAGLSSCCEHLGTI